jgi:hypothetical protein
MRRIHLQKDDLDWLPPSLKAVRWTVAGTIWTGILGTAIGSSVLLHSAGGWIGGVGKSIIVGGLVAGDRAARAVLRRRLGKLARGEVALSRLKQEPDGELVHVRGRVRARQTLTGLLDDQAQGVFRRVQIFLGQHHRIVSEEAVDFALVDDRGEHIIVQVADARIVAPELKPEKMRAEGPKADRLLALPLPKDCAKWLEQRAKRQRKRKRAPEMSASEFLLRDGDEIEVVGYKNRVVDVSVESRLERDTPLRATLRSGRELPVIISPALRRR